MMKLIGAMAMGLALAAVLCGDSARLAAQAVPVDTVTWVNQTRDVRTLTVTTPAGSLVMGTFSRGGVLSVPFRIEGPTALSVSWQAGDQSGQFALDGDSPRFQRIDLTAYGPRGPYESNGPVR